jgi:glutaminyl-peptide cyclotransferase
MKNRNGLKILLATIILAVNFSSCTNNTKSENETTVEQQEETIVTVSFPSKATIYTVGDTVKLALTYDSTKTVTSVELYLDNTKIHVSNSKVTSFVIKTDSLMVGTHSFSCKIKKGNEYVDVDNITFTLLSDITPVVGDYKIKKIIHHETNAYTQGLIIENGKLYEGTGMYGESVLKEVNPKTGETIRDIGISQEYFGEGITIVGNKIVQLTWRTNIGFVYEKTTFKKLREFSYSTEGWGLTFDGKNLIMSDGSENLFYMDTTNYSVLRKIQVYDNHTAITKLNELEYVDGYIYANIYTTDFIVKIDPKTGKVVERWEMPDLLNESDKLPETDVLNGIAYNKETKHFLITGKYWPKMFDMILK